MLHYDFSPTCLEDAIIIVSCFCTVRVSIDIQPAAASKSITYEAMTTGADLAIGRLHLRA